MSELFKFRHEATLVPKVFLGFLCEQSETIAQQAKRAGVDVKMCIQSYQLNKTQKTNARATTPFLELGGVHKNQKTSPENLFLSGDNQQTPSSDNNNPSNSR